MTLTRHRTTPGSELRRLLEADLTGLPPAAAGRIEAATQQAIDREWEALAVRAATGPATSPAAGQQGDGQGGGLLARVLDGAPAGGPLATVLTALPPVAATAVVRAATTDDGIPRFEVFALLGRSDEPAEPGGKQPTLLEFAKGVRRALRPLAVTAPDMLAAFAPEGEGPEWVAESILAKKLGSGQRRRTAVSFTIPPALGAAVRAALGNTPAG